MKFRQKGASPALRYALGALTAFGTLVASPEHIINNLAPMSLAFTIYGD